MSKILEVKCPQCDKIFQYYTSESRPFCSEKCKMIDLGHWFEESYRVPVNGSQIEDNLEEVENENFNLENIDETESEEYK
jgi:endogenous inhibitor of DNA gyrase (YacG/DUF329 family)